MIDLVNRRFVLFYFNVGRGRVGSDGAASDFIRQFEGSRFEGRAVPTPPVWVCTADGELVARINNYTPRDEFFDRLREILEENPAHSEPANGERAILEAASAEGAGPDVLLAAGKLREDLGEYEEACPLYRRAAEDTGTSESRARAHLGLARIARYAKDWERIEEPLAFVEESSGGDFDDEIAMERAYRLFDRGENEAVRDLLVAAIKDHPDSTRMGEMHFWAGVACYRLGVKDWAHFHWGWVMENIPDDYNYMRCYLGMTAEVMPWGIPELGTEGRSGFITHDRADAARDRAMEDYHRLKDEF